MRACAVVTCVSMCARGIGNSCRYVCIYCACTHGGRWVFDNAHASLLSAQSFAYSALVIRTLQKIVLPTITMVSLRHVVIVTMCVNCLNTYLFEFAERSLRPVLPYAFLVFVCWSGTRLLHIAARPLIHAAIVAMCMRSLNLYLVVSAERSSRPILPYVFYMFLLVWCAALTNRSAVVETHVAIFRIHLCRSKATLHSLTLCFGLCHTRDD